MVLEKVLVLGATGYVGKRLVSSLLKEGYKVRASWRTLSKLERHSWAYHPKVEPVVIDMFEKKLLTVARIFTLACVETLIYTSPIYSIVIY